MELNNNIIKGPNALKKYKGEQVLFSTNIERFDEFDDQSEVFLFITKNNILIKSEKQNIRNFNIDDIESLTIST